MIEYPGIAGQPGLVAALVEAGRRGEVVGSDPVAMRSTRWELGRTLFFLAEAMMFFFQWKMIELELF